MLTDKGGKKVLLLAIWEKLKPKIKTVYVVKRYELTNVVSEPVEIVEWSELEEIFEDFTSQIENENKHDEGNEDL